jgi:hypothetical protein
MEVAGTQGRRPKRLLDDLKETGEYWKLKDETLDGTLQRARHGRGRRGRVVRQTTSE